MLPQPDWKLTPEFEMLNHRRLAREYLPGFIPTVNLVWEQPRSSKGPDHDEYVGMDLDELEPIKTREDYVKQVRTALEESCLEPMLQPEEDIDLVCAVHVIRYSTGSHNIVLPAPTHQTTANAVSAGYASLDVLLQTLSYEIKKMSLTPELIVA
jgi:hypothetical protein